jgi:hypothetical protein
MLTRKSFKTPFSTSLANATLQSHLQHTSRFTDGPTHKSF